MKTNPLLADKHLLSFEKSHACVLFFPDMGEGNRKCALPRLFVQILDEYGFQREMILQKHLDGDTATWELRIYQHPGRREQQTVTEKKAIAFITRFLELCGNYPDLLFNQTNSLLARNHGFVMLAERLHRGEELNCKMID